MNAPKRIGSFAIVLAGAFAMMAAGRLNSDAGARKAAKASNGADSKSAV